MKALIAVLLLACGCGAAVEDTSDEPGGAPAEIHAWLASGAYLSFDAESHVAPGIAQGGRRVFLNPAAADAVSSGIQAQPGAIAVRELYADDLKTLTGWGFSQRTDVGWLYYETFDRTAPDAHTTHGIDAPLCAGCHNGGMRSDWPLP